jgi:hypothetical protein
MKRRVRRKTQATPRKKLKKEESSDEEQNNNNNNDNNDNANTSDDSDDHDDVEIVKDSKKYKKSVISLKRASSTFEITQSESNSSMTRKNSILDDNDGEVKLTATSKQKLEKKLSSMLLSTNIISNESGMEFVLFNPFLRDKSEEEESKYEKMLTSKGEDEGDDDDMHDEENMIEEHPLLDLPPELIVLIFRYDIYSISTSLSESL